MKLYEIDQALLDLTDPETGEILDISAFQALQMERERKLEGMGCWIKDMDAEIDALKREEDALRMRRQKTMNRRRQVWTYLQQMLGGEKLKTARVAISYRKNPPTVKVTDVEALRCWAMESGHPELKDSDPEEVLLRWVQENGREDLLRITAALDKTRLKEAINAGDEIPGAEVVQEIGMVIR